MYVSVVRRGANHRRRLGRDSSKDLHRKPEDEYSKSTAHLSFRKKVWLTLDDPNFSRTAKRISMFIMVIIALSVINFIVGTEITPRCGWRSTGSAPDDVTYECGDSKLSDTGVSSDVLNALETICIMVFSVEYVLRILTCTTSMSLASFLFAPMNAIDLVAILPYYLDLVLAAASTAWSGAALRRRPRQGPSAAPAPPRGAPAGTGPRQA